MTVPDENRVVTGEALMKSVAEHLPNHWLASGDGVSEEFADQQNYGSDILLLKRIPVKIAIRQGTI